jgi:trehalose 6-phosphate synthase/phosphatase
MARTIIVSNRLPVKVVKDKNGDLLYKPSEGGLATGLSSIYKSGNNLWIGWPGRYFKSKVNEKAAFDALVSQNMHPVFLSKEEIKLYYEGFSNETLWPNFHYFNQNALYKKSYWDAYVKVNEKFCDEIIKVLKPGDKIWVQDYHLMLVPKMIRDKRPDVSIGFFLHIPFPSFEVFRLLPWRRELLDGVLGSDLVGFHTYDDMRHFLSSVSRICYISNHQGQILKDSRTVVTDSFPIGIDYDKYADQAADPKTLSLVKEYRASLGKQKLIISIDRLDYSKGIPARLEIFNIFLQHYPEYQGKVSLLMVVVPSRDQVEKYKDLKESIDILVGRINGEYGTLNWTPIHYFYRSFPLEDLSAFYKMADVAMVTPMRDGMNLVCKEYLASRLDQTGVLILSEMAGASKELSDALIVNPNDKNQVVEAIYRALKMPEKEQIYHNAIMQKTLKKFNIHHWVKLFLTKLDDVVKNREEQATKVIDNKIKSRIKKEYSAANKRVLFLDYDGTLVPFDNDPMAVLPGDELRKILKDLSDDVKNHVVIISGRDRVTLEKWLGDLPIDFIGEHGVWLKENTGEWTMSEGLVNKWKREIGPILDIYVNKTPGSFMEEKDYSLVWHYRKVEAGLGELRAREIISHLKYLAVNMNLQVLEGNKVVEIKNIEVNKGKAASKWLSKIKPDFIIALGDDWTDEDTFKAMPEFAHTIKVGNIHSAAKYSINDYIAVRDLLKELPK